MRNVVVAIVFLILLSGGVLYFINSNKNSDNPQSILPDLQTDFSTSTQSASLNNENIRILAGNVATYIEFRQSDYEKALSENKIIFLDFYANWCPICRAEEPEIRAGFDALTQEVSGFRVNFKDPETDENEKKLAEQFNVPVQHTKIILKNGQEFSRSSDTWTLEDFNIAINKALSN